MLAPVLVLLLHPVIPSEFFEFTEALLPVLLVLVNRILVMRAGGGNTVCGTTLMEYSREEASHHYVSQVMVLAGDVEQRCHRSLMQVTGNHDPRYGQCCNYR